MADVSEHGREFLTVAYGRWERWTADGGYATPAEWLARLVESTIEELACVSELPQAARFAFEEEVALGQPAIEALQDRRAPELLAEFAELLRPLDRTGPEQITALFKALRATGRERYGMRGREVMFAVRAALTGAVAGPCLEVVVCLLGRQRCLERVARWRAVDPEVTSERQNDLHGGGG